MDSIFLVFFFKETETVSGTDRSSGCDKERQMETETVESEDSHCCYMTCPHTQEESAGLRGLSRAVEQLHIL